MEKGKITLTQKDAENTPAGGVVVGKRDGQTMIYDDASLGGYFVGKLHKDGGIKMINKSTGQPLEVQGAEVIITAPAVNDQTKREFEGKMMTNREILSKINSDGGGVSFADGGDIPAKIHTTDCEYKFGGKVVKDTDIAHSLGMNSTLKKGKQHFSSGDTTYDVDAIYNAIKKGKLRLKTKEVETFPMKYPVYDKHYAENHKIDFRKPNGITVRTESGEEILIDGNHRMNNAYSKGRKTMKTYYIEDPKQIARFTKKNKFELGGENKVGGHLSKGKSLKQIAEMHHVSLAHINEQLAKGLEVEKEHFVDFKERTRVAKDHLVENPNYYTILEKAGLKDGGHLRHHRHGENLVKDAKDGNTPARDLNNYNDLLDVQADGEVGGDTGIDMDGALVTGDVGAVNAFANGGSVNFWEKEDVTIVNGDYGKIAEVVQSYKDDTMRGNYFVVFRNLKGKIVSYKDNFETYKLALDYAKENVNNEENYANGGVTPYDANIEGDSVDIIENDFAKGGVVYDTTKPKIEKVTIKDTYDDRVSIVGRYASNVSELEQILSDYLKNSPESWDWIKFYVNDNTRGSYEIALIKGQKNTVKNVNPDTINSTNIKRVIDAKDYLVKNYDWTDFFELGSQTPVSKSSQLKYPEYYKFIGKSSDSFTYGKIYKIRNPKDIEDMQNFIDNLGFANGFSGENYQKFEPSTKEAFLSQQSVSSNLTSTKAILTKEELVNSKIWIGDDLKLLEQVKDKLESLGFNKDKVESGDTNISIFIFNDDFYIMALREKSDVFNDSSLKEIFPSDLGINVSASISTSNTDKEVQSVLIKYGNGDEYNALNKESLLSMLQDIWDSNGKTLRTVQIQPQGKDSSLSVFKIVDLIENPTNDEYEINPDKITLDELRDKLSKEKEWYDDLDWSKFFNIPATVKKENVVSSVRLNFEKEDGTPYNKITATSGKELVKELDYAENNWLSADDDFFRVWFIAYYTDKNGNISSISEQINFGDKFFLPSNWSYDKFKEIVYKDWFDNKLDFSEFFDKIPTTSNNLTKSVTSKDEVYKVIFNYNTGTPRTLTCSNGSELFSAYRIIEDEAEGGTLQVTTTYSAVDKNGNISAITKTMQEVGQGGFEPSQIYSIEEFEEIVKGWIPEFDFTEFFNGIKVANSSGSSASSNNTNASTSANKLLTYEEAQKSKIWIGKDENLKNLVVEKLNNLGFDIDTEYKGDGNKAIFTFVHYFGIGGGFTKEEFDKDPAKEIFPSDLGIDLSVSQAPANTAINQGSNLAPYEASQVTLTWNNKFGTEQTSYFYTDDGIGGSGQSFISTLKGIERDSNGKDVELTIRAYAKDNNGNEFGKNDYFTIGEKYFKPSTRTNEQIKSVTEEWIDGVNFDKFFEDVIPLNTTKKEKVRFLTTTFANTGKDVNDVGELSDYISDFVANTNMAFSNGSKVYIYTYVNGDKSSEPFIIALGENISCDNCLDILKDGVERLEEIILFNENSNLYDWSKFFKEEPATQNQPFDFSDTKIWIGDNPELSRRVQEKAFESGYKWGGLDRYVQNTERKDLYFNGAGKTINGGGDDRNDFDKATYFREITEQDIFGGQATATQYKPIDLSNTKIWIGNDVEINKQVQERAFELGWSWKKLASPNKINFSLKPAFYFHSDKDISYGDDRQLFVSNKDFREITFKELFEKIEPKPSIQTPTISGASGSVKKIEDLKEAVGVLESIASQASQKYNTKKYDENLELLKQVKEEYALALSFTPESSFMYERIELMKKIAEIQKEITRITELKSGGAYYIFSKVIDRLERGENWKELGNGEIMVNEVPQQEIESVIYTEKFKNWFGDWEEALITKDYDFVSKAITESGKPCVMYHGAKRIKYSYRQVSNGVVYLAENRSYAEWFSATNSPYQKQGDYLTQCFVNIKNPIDLTPFGVEEVDLRDIIQYIDALYPLAKIYDVLPPNVAMAIMSNHLIGTNFRAWYVIRQFPELNKHIRDNTTYDGFIYYENNPSDMILNESGEMVENVTKATAVFNSNQVKLVDAMLFDGSLDDWRFEKGGKVN